MYIPEHFAETRVDVLHDLVRRHPLGTLVALTPEGLDANHIPFDLDPAPVPFGTLRGHVARANSFWRKVSPDSEVLAIFQGPDAYIRPDWYPTKRETGKVAPTWNYAVVHAYGPLRVIEDRTRLRELVERLTDHHERERPDPWKVTDAPEDYVEARLGEIVGIEIPITRLIGKWKTSQNRGPADRDGVIAGLLQEGCESATAIARLVPRGKGE